MVSLSRPPTSKLYDAQLNEYLLLFDAPIADKKNATTYYLSITKQCSHSHVRSYQS